MGFLSGILGTNNSFSSSNQIQAGSPQQEQQQAQDAVAQQQAFAQAAGAQNGLGNQASVFNQLQGVANGTGPNPAQAQLAQATGANVANQAALMAGQRGASANAGLIARQAGQQGANTQQQAVGQAATLQANQSLNALGQLGGIAGQQVSQQQGALSGLNSSAQGLDSITQNALQNQNATNAGIAQQNASNNQSLVSGVLGAGASVLTGGAAHAHGGMIHAYADGGEVDDVPYGHHLKSDSPKVPSIVSPGEVYLSPQKAMQVAKGKESPMSGERIPGKAKVQGDSYANDTVPRMLEQGGIVIPRSISESANPEKHAAAFVKAVLAQNKLRKR